MSKIKLIALLVMAGLVSACADARVASRNAQIDATSPAVFAPAVPSVSVERISVRVPKSLSVSEANRYYPNSDIVWRGEPLGDRHQQVAQLLHDGLTKGSNDLQGATAVNLDVELLRFHAITEKARYSTGGVHNIMFSLEVTNAETGLPMGERRVVSADLRALGGLEAIAAEGRGETQRVRIERHLAKVIQDELTLPDGHQNAQLGLLQQINRL